ncbi:MAG: hypothetical protein KDK36_15050 [Leptospiraceae bacterium]|nr:hypothetical protein [Leptospiraceae bacterium]
MKTTFLPLILSIFFSCSITWDFQKEENKNFENNSSKNICIVNELDYSETNIIYSPENLFNVYSVPDDFSFGIFAGESNSINPNLYDEVYKSMFLESIQVADKLKKEIGEEYNIQLVNRIVDTSNFEKHISYTFKTKNLEENEITEDKKSSISKYNIPAYEDCKISSANSTMIFSGKGCITHFDEIKQQVIKDELRFYLQLYDLDLVELEKESPVRCDKKLILTSRILKFELVEEKPILIPLTLISAVTLGIIPFYLPEMYYNFHIFEKKEELEEISNFQLGSHRLFSPLFLPLFKKFEMSKNKEYNKEKVEDYFIRVIKSYIRN